MPCTIAVSAPPPLREDGRAPPGVPILQHHVREHENIALAVEIGDLLLAQAATNRDVLGEALTRHRLLQPLSPRAIAHDAEPDVRQLPPQERHRVDEMVEALSLDEPADTQDVTPVPP